MIYLFVLYRITTKDSKENVNEMLLKLTKNGIFKHEISHLVSFSLLSFIWLFMETKANGLNINPGPLAIKTKQKLKLKYDILKNSWEKHPKNNKLQYECHKLAEKLNTQKRNTEQVEEASEESDFEIVEVKFQKKKKLTHQSEETG